MKRNTIYHIYEGLALILTCLSWWAFFYSAYTVETTHWQSLSHTLETIHANAYTASQDALISLRKDVRKQGNSREGLERVKRAELLIKKTNGIFTKLEEAKGYLQKLDPAEQATTERFMVRSGFAYQLKANLDDYTRWLQNEFRDLDLPKFAPLAEGNEKNPLYQISEPDRDFAYNYFASTSATEAMALITQKQTEVKRYEKAVLGKLWNEPGFFSCYGCGWIGLKLWQTNYIIPVGETYTAAMFIGRAVSEANPQMMMNNQFLTIWNGTTEIGFETQKTGQQFWEGKIVYKHEGRYKTVTHKVPFEVWSKNEH